MSADYVELEAEGQRATLYDDGGERSDLPERLADAIADLRKQLDEAMAGWDQAFKIGISHQVRADAWKAKAEGVGAAAEHIFQTFSRDEEQGYRSRDRQFTIALLKPFFAPTLDAGEESAPTDTSGHRAIQEQGDE